jgi:hypothetical protein
MDLTDPTLEQEVLSAQSSLKGSEADYKSLQATLQSTLMDKKIAAAQVNASYTQDQLQAQTDEALYKLGVVSGLVSSASKNTADQLTAQHKLSLEQLDVNQKAIEVQLASAQNKIDQAKAQLDLYEKQSAALHVRAGISGVLAQLPTPLQVGQHVTAGHGPADFPLRLAAGRFRMRPGHERVSLLRFSALVRRQVPRLHPLGLPLDLGQPRRGSAHAGGELESGQCAAGGLRPIPQHTRFPTASDGSGHAL